jgi:ABC-type cobalamin/Fe3+-siderophores transport system ATPase subunit
MSVLVADDLQFRHESRLILDGVCCRCRVGELVGLIGPNGAGKSSLLRVLAGLRRPDRGSVSLAGADLATMPAAQRGRLVGYLPQHFEPTWDYTVRDVLALGASRASTPTPRLGTLARDFDLEPLLERPWSRLSGGERARALAAAVLVADPQVLLADEPGASLDVQYRSALLERLSLEARRRIVIVVLHDLELAVRCCARLIVMNAGRIALDADAAVAARDPRLDAAFNIRFQRVPIDPSLGPLLPMASPGPATAAHPAGGAG